MAFQGISRLSFKAFKAFQGCSPSVFGVLAICRNRMAFWLSRCETMPESPTEVRRRRLSPRSPSTILAAKERSIGDCVPIATTVFFLKLTQKTLR
jgi:hypothetical protein